MNDLDHKLEGPGASYEGLEKALRDQLRRQPDLALARVMLLELYFKTGRRNAYLAEARKLYKREANPETSLEWQRCASMGRVLDPGQELYRRGSTELLDAAQAATAASSARKHRRLSEREHHAAAFRALATAYEDALRDRRFLSALDLELLHAANRPSSLLHLGNLSRHLGGAALYLKREDLAPPGTHLTMMITGQVLLARHLGCKAVVTSTVNGCRGVLTAAVAARFDLPCIVYVDARDRQRHLPNVFRMSLMGADLRTIEAQGVRNQDVRQVALEHWVADPKQCFMVTGLDAVPEPYPSMHREFTSAIGRECKRQVMGAAHRLPDLLVARGRGTADAVGFFPPFLPDASTRLVCVDAAAPAGGPAPADDDASDASPPTEEERRRAPETLEGLDYPSVEREHTFLRATGRVDYVGVGDEGIQDTILNLAKLEGLLPSLSLARPLAWACEEARSRDPAQVVVVMFAEDHEKDLPQLARKFGMSLSPEAS